MYDFMHDLVLQVRRLDVENGDILTVRTARVLTRTQADAAHDLVAALVAKAGVRDVSVMVLDNCTDLTIERPDTRMQCRTPRV